VHLVGFDDSDKSVFSLILASLFLFLLSACSIAHTPANTVEDATRQGIIVPITEQTTRELELGTTRVGDIEQHLQYHVLPVFPNRRALAFDRYGGVFSGPYVSANSRVYVGELLATQSFTQQEPIEIERDLIALQYSRHQARTQTELLTRNQEIAESRRANSSDLALQEHRLQQFIFDSDNYSDYLRGRLDALDKYLASEELYAPFDGMVVYATMLDAGTYIENPGRTIVEIVCDSIVHFAVTAPPTVIRYGDQFTIRQQGGNLEFHVKVISDPLASRPRANEMQFILAAVCHDTMQETLDAAGLTAFELANISFTLTTSIPLAIDAVLAPRDAIHPEDGRYFVFVYDNGNLLKRYVTVGVQFGNDAQILAGLTPGQKVMLRQ